MVDAQGGVIKWTQRVDIHGGCIRWKQRVDIYVVIQGENTK